MSVVRTFLIHYRARVGGATAHEMSPTSLAERVPLSSSAWIKFSVGTHGYNVRHRFSCPALT